MDSIVTAICFFIALLSITAVVTRIARKSIASDVLCSKPLPPVVTGITVLKLLLTTFTRELPDTMNSLHETFGSVFTISLFGLNVTFLVGSEVSQHFFQGRESEISHGTLFEFTVPIVGQHVGYAVDAATRKEQNGFFIDSVTKPSALRTHIDPMLQVVEDYFSKWGQDGIVDLKHEFGRVLMLIATRRMVGKEIGDKIFDEVCSLFHIIENSVSFIGILFPNIPIPAHKRRDQVRVKLEEIFSKIIRSRRNSSLVEDDILQKLIDSKYKDGRNTTDEEVSGMILSLLLAGKPTSSHASIWTGIRLLSNAKWWSAAVDEQKKIIRKYKGQIDYTSLLEMDFLYRCIKETLRMHAPVPMLIRKAHKNFFVQTKEGNEYEIPAEHSLVLPVVVSSMMPSVYKDPHVYDPDRFSDPGRKEDKVGGIYSYVPFGSGKFACVGEGYAYLQMKILWRHVLRNFELKLVSTYPKTDWSSLPSGPKGKVLVTYTRRCLPNT